MSRRLRKKIHDWFLLLITWLMCVVLFTTYWLIELSTKVHIGLVVALIISLVWVVSFICINYKYIEKRWGENELHS